MPNVGINPGDSREGSGAGPSAPEIHRVAVGDSRVAPFNNFFDPLPLDFSVWKNLTSVNLSNNRFNANSPKSKNAGKLSEKVLLGIVVGVSSLGH
nr:probable inactive receptor kinase At4g23740 [Ipomoea batatas]